MRKRLLIWIALIAVVAIPVWYAFAHGYRSTTSSTCVRCRAIKYSESFFWRESERIEETDYSRWYAQHQPAHTHRWGWCGTVMTYYPVSTARGCGDRHPIWEISPERQREFIESATRPELESFYVGLDSPDSVAQRKAVDMIWERLLRDAK